MSRRKGVSVGVKIDGDAKGFKAASEDARKATENLQRRSKRSGSGIQATFRKITMAMGPIALAIGAIVGAFKAFTNILTGSIAGQEKFARVTGYLSGIMDGLKDIAIDVTNWMVKAFDDPKQSVIDLWETIKGFFITPFEGMVGMVTSGWEIIAQGAKGVGLAIAGIFKKDLREQSREAFARMTQGMDDFTESVKMTYQPFRDIGKAVSDIGKELGERAKENADLAERELKLRQQIADESVQLKKLDADISRLRRIANDDQQELTDQIQAQAEAMDVIEKKFDIQEDQLKEAVAIQKERMALGHDTVEDVEKLRQLEAELIGLQTTRDDQMRTLLRRYGTLINRAEALEEAERKAAEDARKAREEVMEDIEEYYMTELQLLDKRMDEMLASHEWTEKEKTKITEHFTHKREKLLAGEVEAAETAAFNIRDAYKDSLMEISSSFNQMAQAGRASTKQIIQQSLASITALIIKSIWASGLPLMGKIGLSAGASLLSGKLTAQIPSFSTPGIVKRDMIARVGDYPNVKRDPEVISPLSDLSKYMPSRPTKILLEVTGKAAGRDLALVLNRYVVEEELST